MQRFSRVLLGSAAAFALVSGAIAFSTSQASAQIPFIGNLPGFVPHGSFGSSHYHSRHGRSEHEVRHERRSKEKDAKDDDSGKGDDSANNKPDRVQFSAHGSAPETAASSPPAPSAPAPAPPSSGQPSGDVPSFTPEK